MPDTAACQRLMAEAFQLLFVLTECEILESSHPGSLLAADCSFVGCVIALQGITSLWFLYMTPILIYRSKSPGLRINLIRRYSESS